MLLKFAILHLHNIHTSTPLLNAQWAKRQVLKEIILRNSIKWNEKVGNVRFLEIYNLGTLRKCLYLKGLRIMIYPFDNLKPNT